ncbi:MAG: hypothetical protein IPG50_15365 [Myxococcales bacterium]|nr:hypothetical protein [Myxococcales bacterium]
MKSPLLLSAVLSLAVAHVGCSAAPEALADDDAPLSAARSDATIEAELRAAVQGALYISEADYPFEVVHAPLPQGTRSLTAELLQERLATYVDRHADADKPLLELKSMTKSFAAWRHGFATCRDHEGAYPEQCPRISRINAALAKNLRGVRVYYFGREGEEGNVEGTTVSIFVVGVTPQGNLAGVWTLAAWT